MKQVELLQRTVETLESLAIPYAVVGSWGSGIYGEARFTRDIDIVLELPMSDVASFCAAFPAGEFYLQIKLKHLERENVVEQRFSPDDVVEKIILNREEWEFSYRDGDMFVFMNPSNFEQVYVSVKEVPEAQHIFMVPNMKISLLKIEDKVVQVEMPQTVEVDVTDAPDAARGDTATSVTKLCTIETGGQVRVPGHIRKGDRIKVRVEDGEFRGRA